MRIGTLAEVVGRENENLKQANPVFVLACSALMAKYRRILETGGK